MITRAEIVQREGIPDDTVMVQVPATGLWMECKRLKNANWTVTLQDPLTKWEKEVWRSIPRIELERVISGMFAGSMLWQKEARPSVTYRHIKSLYSPVRTI